MSENTNVFNENQDYLMAARDAVVARDGMATELERLRASQKKLSKSIVAEDKSIADEIASTIKKRKQEISDTFDGRLDDNRARKKKVANKRDKKKTQRVNERIQEETKDIRANNKELNVELKTLLKKNNVPSICRKNIFYYMFMPKGMAEIGLMLLSFLVYFVGIPAGLLFVIRNTALKGKDLKNPALINAVIVFIIIIILFIIYFAIYNATKAKHRAVLDEANGIRDKIKANKRNMDAISNSINKDRDESQYNLGAYDKKLANLDKEADNIGNDKQEALKHFENETKQLIIDEINGRRLQTLEDMKAEKKALDDKITKGEKMYSDKVIEITKQYASYIGEDMCKEDKLSDLITLMQEGQASTVSEAISIYKGQKVSK